MFCSLAYSQKPFSSRAVDYYWIYERSVWTNVLGRFSFKIDTPVIQYNGKSYYSCETYKIADSGSKVFAFNGAKEYLLMDYSLNVGDTLITFYNSNPFKLRVNAKSKIKIEHDSLWRMDLKSVDFPLNTPILTWVESIGCLHSFHPMNWPMLFGAADLAYNLNCVIHSDTSILGSLAKKCELSNDLMEHHRKWIVWTSENNGDQKFSSYFQFLTTDTLIAGKQYRRMNVPNTFVRYDSFTGIYYVLSNLLGQEIRVYHERAKVGDTVYNANGTIDTTQSIEYVWVNNVLRKKTITNRDTFYSVIGSVIKVLWDNHLIRVPEYQAGNICYSELNSIQYHFPFFYQNREQCEITSRIQNISLDSFSFYPNPVLNHIQFHNLDVKEFAVRNSLGVKILGGQCGDKLDISSLPQGLYFIDVDYKGKRFFFKIVKNSLD